MQICIIGAGAWGTALAIHFAQNGQQVCLWTRDAEHAAAMRAERINSGYLKDFPFPDQLAVADTPPPKPEPTPSPPNTNRERSNCNGSKSKQAT